MEIVQKEEYLAALQISKKLSNKEKKYFLSLVPNLDVNDMVKVDGWYYFESCNKEVDFIYYMGIKKVVKKYPLSYLKFDGISDVRQNIRYIRGGSIKWTRWNKLYVMLSSLMLMFLSNSLMLHNFFNLLPESWIINNYHFAFAFVYGILIGNFFRVI